MEVYYVIPEFPEFEINKDGVVRKIENFEVVQHVFDKLTNHVFVLLENKYCKSYVPVYKLLANMFIENPENFSDILFTDGCFSNLQLDNLKWCE